jgi:hypothetical protein
MLTSRPVPQSTAQIFSPRAGQYRSARRLLQIGQIFLSATGRWSAKIRVAIKIYYIPCRTKAMLGAKLHKFVLTDPLHRIGAPQGGHFMLAEKHGATLALGATALGSDPSKRNSARRVASSQQGLGKLRRARDLLQ